MNLAYPSGIAMMMWQVFLILAAGVANWIITYIIVEGALFAELRTWVAGKCEEVKQRCDTCPQTFGTKSRRWCAGKAVYFVKCHLCVGTWVGFALTPFVPGPFHSPIFGVAMVLNGLVIKGFGHATLELTSAWRTRVALNEAERDLARKRAELAVAEREAVQDGSAVLWPFPRDERVYINSSQG